MVLQGSNLDFLLKKAKEQEKKYEWLDSADFYKEASSLVQEDYAKASEIQERIGYCFLRAAFQAETNEQFRSRLRQSADAYQKTISLYQKTLTEDKEAKINHAEAMVAYVRARVESNIPKKRKLLAEWEKLENDALKYYEKVGNKLAIGKICNELVERSLDKRTLASNWNDIKENMLQAVNYAEKAIDALSEVDNDYELTRAYLIAYSSYFAALWFRAL